LTDRQLGDLELLLSGGFRPLRGYLGSAEVEAVTTTGRLADGTPWPVPVVLDVPEQVAKALGSGGVGLTLEDPEGVPLAVVRVEEVWRPVRPTPVDEYPCHVAGPVDQLRRPEYGTFRRLRRPPAEVRAAVGDGPVLAVPVAAPLHHPQLALVRRLAQELQARVLLLPLVGAGTAREVSPDGLVRTVLAAAETLAPAAMVVTVPLATRGAGVAEEHWWATVAGSYGATHVVVSAEAAATAPDGLPVALVPAREMVRPVDGDGWLPAEEVPPHRRAGQLTGVQRAAMLDAGEPLPAWYTPLAVARELRRAHPPRSEEGVTVLFSGLSGSGKSTLARQLNDALLERGDRTVTLLDGDVVRRLLSAGLTFSKEHRDLNVRRIGYVAAEVTRHGGVAICAPIAPYARARADVRAMVSAVGAFVLVWVSTPLEVCEQRDRKGLYAKARAGLIPEFTGVSDPYEEPQDADLVLDTSVVSLEHAVTAVLDLMVERGFLRAAPGGRHAAGRHA